MCSSHSFIFLGSLQVLSKKKTDLIVIISRDVNLLDFSSTLDCVRLHIFGSLEFVNFFGRSMTQECVLPQNSEIVINT